MSLAYSLTDSQTEQRSSDPDKDSRIQYVSMRTPAIVVVGTGPVGLHFVHELVRRGVDTPVVLYGAEPWQPYDRVKL